MTNIGFQIHDDEVGYDETLWVAEHEKVFGDNVEKWLSDLTAGSDAPAIAADIVRTNRKQT
jgi:hypothetical protein